MSSIIVAGNNAIAQTLETITEQRKAFENNPQIKVGSEPSGIAVNEITNKIYVTNLKSGTVSVIDSNSGSGAKDIRVGDAPISIAVDSDHNKIYVANEDSNTVSVIDGNNDTVIGQKSVGPSPQHILLLGSKIYVTNRDSNTVSVINASNDRKERHDIPVGKGPMYMGAGNGKIYVTNSGSNTVSVINATNDKKEPNDIPVGNHPTYIAVGPARSAYIIRPGDKIYVANRDSNTVSVINASNDRKERHDISVIHIPFSIAVDSDHNKIYVVSKRSALSGGINYVSVINGDTNKLEQDISLRKGGPGFPDIALVDHKIYIANSFNNTVSVINGTDIRDTYSESSSYSLILSYTLPDAIRVGESPTHIAVNGNTGMIYVANEDSNTVSVIDGSSAKVAAGVTLNTHPATSGKIICNSKEYPTSIYLYVDAGTNCIAQHNKDFEFSGWVENLNGNSTIPLGDSSGNLTVNRYGTFTANFIPIPPAIPPEFLYLLVGIILSSLFGWSIPSIMGWAKAKRQQGRVHEYRTQINSLYADGKLDENDIGSLDKLKKDVTDVYAQGRITDQQNENLKNEISLLYEEIYDKKIGLLNGVLGKNDDKSLDIMKNDITDAYAKGKISDLHYNVLNEKISKAANDNTSKRNKDIQFDKRTPV